MGVASVLDTCEAFAVTTARQPGRPIRALFLSDGTVVPRRNRPPTLAPLSAWGLRTATEPHQHQYPYRTEDADPRHRDELIAASEANRRSASSSTAPSRSRTTCSSTGGGRAQSASRHWRRSWCSARTDASTVVRRWTRADGAAASWPPPTTILPPQTDNAMMTSTVDRSPRCPRRPRPRLPDRANEHHPRRGLGPAAAGRSVAKFVCGVARRVPCHATWLARDRPDPAVNLAVCPYCSRATCSRRPAP